MKGKWPVGLQLDADVAQALEGVAIRIDSLGYPVARIDGVRTRLHRHVAGHPAGMDVDHINRDKLDCRRQNLRLATRQQNSCNAGRRTHNTSGYRGVYLCKFTRRWRAEIRANGAAHKLGRFSDPAEAAAAYDAAAIRLHGDFAVTNRSLGLLS